MCALNSSLCMFPFALFILLPYLAAPPRLIFGPLCAAKEELVLAALRLEALQVAQSISQCPSLSTVTPQVLR